MHATHSFRSNPFRAATLIALAWLLLVVPALAEADDAQTKRVRQSEAATKSEAKQPTVIELNQPADFWLGLALQLSDGEGPGLAVTDVLPDSPAAKAGLRQGDVVLEADGQPIGDFAALQQRVQQSRGKPLAIQVLREGKKLTIKVTPARRPTAGPLVIWDEKQASQGKPPVIEPKKAVPKPKPEVAAQAPTSGPLIFTRPQPSAAPFPDDLSVTIQKKGNQPARLKVSQGKESWNISESETDKLPESIRGHVLRMLPGRAAPRLMAAIPGKPAIAKPAIVDPNERMLHELQELKRQLHELEQKVESLSPGKEGDGSKKSKGAKKSKNTPK